MEQSRRNKMLKVEGNEDRISALPDSLVHHILSFLPSTKQSIQTGILSKRWQNQWTRVPVLIFEFVKHSDKFKSEDFARFIDSTLLQYDCSKIRKFQLGYEFEKDSNFSSKIRFATTRNVEELILNCDFDDVYLLPKFLLDNAWLVKLELLNCYFMDDWSINWRSLKVFNSYFFDNCPCEMVVANVLCGSPSLESLHLRDYGNPGAIASNSLKILILEEFAIKDVSCIEISCPNLEEFSLLSWAECACDGLAKKLIENVVSDCLFLRSMKLEYWCFEEKLVIASKSLKKLVLSRLCDVSKVEISCPNLEELKINSKYEETIFNLVNNFEISQYGKCHVKKAKKIFQQLENVNELTMGSWFIKILSEVGMGGLSYPWYKTKILTLDGPNFEHLPGIMCALRSACTLERLVIKLEVYEGELTSNALGENDWNSNGTTAVKCLVSHLKSVEIIGLSKQDNKCGLVLNFIKFLLKNARVLKRLALVISKDGGTGFAFEISQKVSSFPRRSRHAIVELSCS